MSVKNSSYDSFPDDINLVVGGGVAGSTCAIEIKRWCPSSEVVLVSPTPAVKTVLSVEPITPLLEKIDVGERSAEDFTLDNPGITFVRDESVHDFSRRMENARRVLILGNGGIALELVHTLSSVRTCQVIWAVRDTYVGNTFFDASASAFALEALYAYPESAPSASTTEGLSPICQNHDLEEARSPTAGTGVHGIPSDTKASICSSASESGYSAHKLGQKTREDSRGEAKIVHGAGLGPDWTKTFAVHDEAAVTPRRQPTDKGADDVDEDKKARIQGVSPKIYYETELESVRSDSERTDVDGQCWPVWATLTNGAVVGCDLIISATGVRPNTDILGPEFKRGADGGLLVDDRMRVVSCGNANSSEETNADRCELELTGASARRPRAAQDAIYAAGDCCCLEWPLNESNDWFQIRLWAQARAMGLYAAKCMADRVDELGAAGAFDLFVHATRFFGFKVALLGHFNGQGLGQEVQEVVSKGIWTSADGEHKPGAQARHEARLLNENTSNDVQVLVRSTPGVEYVKVILVNNRVRGAMLIGDTGLEETFENLILSETDISAIGHELLSEHVDIEDYFD